MRNAKADMHSDNEHMLDRCTVVPQLVGDHRHYLIVTGLGGATRDIGHLTKDGPNQFALGGAMGAAVSIGLGLALARPDRKVLVVTGDGELLMGLGTLATAAVMNPRNLSILCVDNGHYLETGGQAAHTSRGTDLALIARGAGMRAVAAVNAESDIDEGAAVLRSQEHCSVVVVRVKPSAPPQHKRNMDAAAVRLRMKAYLTEPAG